MMAQRLYEAGYITYMRTDSTNLSQDAVSMVRSYITDNFGKKYLPEHANQYASKENSQEAHEAIRPSDVGVLGGIPERYGNRRAEALSTDLATICGLSDDACAV